MDDPYDLQRFIDAQNPVFERVLAELRDGEKRSHWMWFIFPQIRGLGESPMAITYAIASRAEATAYLKHPVLGPRLKECTSLVTDVPERAIAQILPYPDNLKFHSCMTLFAEIAPGEEVFQTALRQFYAGQPDTATLKLI
jgi:uncharacterized protein (DUF1810 family)